MEKEAERLLGVLDSGEIRAWRSHRHAFSPLNLSLAGNCGVCGLSCFGVWGRTVKCLSCDLVAHRTCAAPTVTMPACSHAPDEPGGVVRSQDQTPHATDAVNTAARRIPGPVDAGADPLDPCEAARLADDADAAANADLDAPVETSEANGAGPQKSLSSGSLSDAMGALAIAGSVGVGIAGALFGGAVAGPTGALLGINLGRYASVGIAAAKLGMGAGGAVVGYRTTVQVAESHRRWQFDTDARRNWHMLTGVRAGLLALGKLEDVEIPGAWRATAERILQRRGGYQEARPAPPPSTSETVVDEGAPDKGLNGSFMGSWVLPDVQLGSPGDPYRRRSATTPADGSVELLDFDDCTLEEEVQILICRAFQARGSVLAELQETFLKLFHDRHPAAVQLNAEHLHFNSKSAAPLLRSEMSGDSFFIDSPSLDPAQKLHADALPPAMSVAGPLPTEALSGAVAVASSASSSASSASSRASSSLAEPSGEASTPEAATCAPPSPTASTPTPTTVTTGHSAVLDAYGFTHEVLAVILLQIPGLRSCVGTVVTAINAVDRFIFADIYGAVFDELSRHVSEEDARLAERIAMLQEVRRKVLNTQRQRHQQRLAAPDADDAVLVGEEDSDFEHMEPGEAPGAGDAAQDWYHTGYSLDAKRFLSTRAMKLLQKMRVACTALDKLRCALSALEAMTTMEMLVMDQAKPQTAGGGQGDAQDPASAAIPRHVSADELLPSLCAHLVQAGVSDLHGQLVFIKAFVRDDYRTLGAEGYALSSLEAALQIIMTEASYGDADEIDGVGVGEGVGRRAAETTREGIALRSRPGAEATAVPPSGSEGASDEGGICGEANEAKALAAEEDRRRMRSGQVETSEGDLELPVAETDEEEGEPDDEGDPVRKDSDDFEDALDTLEEERRNV